MNKGPTLPVVDSSGASPQRLRGQRPGTGGGDSDLALTRQSLNSQSSNSSGGVTRRDFVRVLSSAMAAVGAAACDRNHEEGILPYVHRPPEVVPGEPRYYATSTERSGYGFGLLAETHTGRPTKLEGHPEHPASLGGTFAAEQAEILSLYDPDRARSVWREHRPQPFAALARALFDDEPFLVPRHGRGMHLLLEPTGSPLITSLLARLLDRLPEAAIHWDPHQAPVHRLQACQQVFGAPLEEHFDWTQAQVVVDLSANFLGAKPMSVRWSHDFAKGRDISSPDGEMNRLYSIETTMSITGATADHRLAVRPSQVRSVAAGLLHVVGQKLEGAVPPHLRDASRRYFEGLSERQRHFVNQLAGDLCAHSGRSAIVVGDRQPPAVHVLGHALNAALSNIGPVVTFTPSPLKGAGDPGRYSFDPLLEALDRNQVHSLFVLGGNPLYTAPGGTHLQRRFERAKQRVVLGAYENETASQATWFVPQAHFLETWGDTCAADGTVSFRQPVISPLFGGHSTESLLAWLAQPRPEQGQRTLSEAPTSGRHLLHRYWSERLSEQGYFEGLSRGLLTPTFQRSTPLVEWSVVERALRDSSTGSSNGKAKLELELLPDPRIEDGRQSNNAWLQETPEPVTKLVWDNAALMSTETANRFKLQRGNVVELSNGEQSIRVPVLPVPGQAHDTISLWLGYGRRGSETVANGVGTDIAPLRKTDNPWRVLGVFLNKTNDHHELVTTQDTFDMHDRDIVLHATKRRWKKHPELFRQHDEAPPNLYEKRLEGAPQWGMTIDLNRCTGCSACVTACIAENNIPVVGKELVAMGREMHWMRLDTYTKREGSEHRVLQQPMLCQHCEKAPCEYVCPVNATVHSDDGLNEMIYNRCVGTRFCSNNCPYKVRRFNWYDFNDGLREPKPMAYNPNVTVRARGVMEKCTFCVQRIRRAEIDAKLERRPLGDGDVTTACAQVCPTKAITFGQLSDKRSRVSENARSERAYGCLNELGTRPRVRYLARIGNPKKEVQG